MRNKFYLYICITIYLFSYQLSAEKAEPNKGLQVIGIGACFFKKLCIVSHKDFMAFEFGLITARSPGFTGLQISPFYNESYGSALFQFAFVNQVKLPDKNSRSGNWTMLQLGALNLASKGQVVGAQFALAANNLPSRQAEEGLPYTKLSPNFSGLQLSGGMNSSQTGIGAQIGFDLHWIIFVFDSGERTRYVSRAKNIYGIQFHPIVQEVEQNMVGLQASLANYSTNVVGFQLGMGNTNKESLLGLQFGALFNETSQLLGAQAGTFNKSDQLIGAQFAFSNLTKKIFGIQIGGLNKLETGAGVQLGIINTGSSELIGFQVGFMNTDSTLTTNAQFGAYNVADKVYGPQIGLINHQENNPFLQIGVYNEASKNSTGAQIGLFNTTDGKANFQIGLLNHAEKNPLSWFPLVNIDYSE